MPISDSKMLTRRAGSLQIASESDMQTLCWIAVNTRQRASLAIMNRRSVRHADQRMSPTSA
jgi:hypothetical protein